MERSQTTPTNLLSLPDETIDQILAELKWGRPEAPDLDELQFYETLIANTPDIQSVRLSCRRLASRAAPSALPIARVSFSDPSTLDRLDDISRHPVLAPRVCAVHVHLDFYDAGIAADTRLLAAYLSHRRGDFPQLKEPFFEKWDAFSAGDVEELPDVAADDEEEEPWSRVLRKERDEYRRRFARQQSSVGDGDCDLFRKRVADAMARMPRATRLVLDDVPEHRKECNEWLAKPLGWAEAFKMGMGSPPVHALFGLPVTVHRAGVKLSGVRIRRLRVPGRIPVWPRPEVMNDDLGFSMVDYDAPPHPDLAMLPAACEPLRVFEFTPGWEPNCWPTDSITHIEWPWKKCKTGYFRSRELIDVLEHFLAAGRSSSLRHLSADMQLVVWNNPDRWITPDPPWPHIRVLHARDCSVEVGALRKFLAAATATDDAGGGLAQLHLDGVELALVPGLYQAAPSWMEVLGILRSYHGRMRENGGGEGDALTVRVRRPLRLDFLYQHWDERHAAVRLSEADCDRMTALFDDEDERGLSAVDRYLNGMKTQNPLVEAGLFPETPIAEVPS